MNIVTDNSRRRYRGRLAPKHCKLQGSFDPRKRVGATTTASGVFGCYDMINPLGGNWFQLQVSRCFGASTAKNVSFFQYGQTGVPIRISMDWCYTGALEEQRRLELGGSPTFQQLEENPLTDTGSEPAAGWDRFRKVGFAPESVFPSTTGFNPRELDLGAEQTAALYLPLSVGQRNIIATPGPDLDAACLAALQPFPDGKRGQSIQIGIASGSTAFENVDGNTVLVASDFNGLNYDHSVDIVGRFPSDLLRGVKPSLPASITGDISVLYNHWEDWGTDTMVPEITSAGVFTGKWIPLPGAVLIDTSAVNAATDWSTLQEAA